MNDVGAATVKALGAERGGAGGGAGLHGIATVKVGAEMKNTKKTYI